MKKRTKKLLCVVALLAHTGASEGQTIAGRDFPKTLTFDEPGIDDEISLPTFIVSPLGPSSDREIDFDFELDKRITPRASLQINTGYTKLLLPNTVASGWQNVQVTFKYVLVAVPADERLASLSLTRDFSHSGAARIAAPSGSTTLAANFGQGSSTFTPSALIKPFAVTGSIGYTLPDRANTPATQQAIVALSVQYSFDVLTANAPAIPAPAFVRPFIPIVEFTYAQPVDGRSARTANLAPGLIYAGDGFQLAAEALVPLARASGRHLGAIAQLNISLGALGVPWLARPLWQ